MWRSISLRLLLPTPARCPRIPRGLCNPWSNPQAQYNCNVNPIDAQCSRRGYPLCYSLFPVLWSFCKKPKDFTCNMNVYFQLYILMNIRCHATLKSLSCEVSTFILALPEASELQRRMHLTSSWHNSFVELVTSWLYPIVEPVTLDFGCTTVSNLCSRERGKIIVLSSAFLLGQMPCWSLIADTHMKNACIHPINWSINQLRTPGMLYVLWNPQSGLRPMGAAKAHSNAHVPRGPLSLGGWFQSLSPISLCVSLVLHVPNLLPFEPWRSFA